MSAASALGLLASDKKIIVEVQKYRVAKSLGLEPTITDELYSYLEPMHPKVGWSESDIAEHIKSLDKKD